MNNIPINIKYFICGISIMIFILFFLGILDPFEIYNAVQNITGYFFGLSINNLDYFAISSIPFFGMLLNSKRIEFKPMDLVKDIPIIGLSVLIVIAIGLYILTFIGKPLNPLIPQYLITEPFFLYSTITIGIGILIPFQLIKRTKKPSEIDDIGNHSGQKCTMNNRL